MSQFKDKWARMSRQIDGYAGERVRVIPRLRGEYSEGAADPSRVGVEIVGVFQRHQGADAIDEGRHGGRIQGSSLIAVYPATLWIRAAVYDGLGYELGQGDAVQLLDQPGLPIYAISRAPRNDVGDVTLILSDET